MSVNIKLEGVESKALSHSNDNSFHMEDVTPIVQRGEVTPKLLTALLGGSTNTVSLQTTTVKYDELTDTAQVPDGKAFNEYGKNIQKDVPRELIYTVPSFGVRGNVAPGDYSTRRIPGTQDLMDEAYLVARLNDKMQVGWTLFEELGYAQLLTTDTNILRGGPHKSYNFYTDIVGNARPAKISMNLAGAVDHWQLFSEQVDLLDTDVEKDMQTSSGTVAICGKNFFNSRLEIEKQAGLARDMRSTLDMQSMGVPTDSFGTGSFKYQNFDSIDGIHYIKYAASIEGSKLIGDNDAYLIPVGTDMMRKVLAPAQTRTYANSVAQELYGWSKEDERTGVTLAQESNVLFTLPRPKLIRALTV